MAGRPRTDAHSRSHPSRSEPRRQSPNGSSIKDKAAAVARTVHKHVDNSFKGSSDVRVLGFGPGKEEQEKIKKEERQYHQRTPQHYQHSSRRKEDRGESNNQDEQAPGHTVEEADSD
ncbi:hypothetical protein ACEPAI_3012 [Sanghuangporus weigelae]